MLSSPRFRLLLASASPRRAALLRDLGLATRVAPARVNEAALPGESPEALVQRLAEAKGRRAASALGPEQPYWLILAADTAVVVKGRVLGKPSSGAHAGEMLRLLRDRTHEVLTGVFLMRNDDGRSTRALERTSVRFRDYDDAEIRSYVESGEPMDKAGAYGIQGGGARLVAHVDGSWSNVVGLPVERLSGWLAGIGLEPADLMPA